MSDKAFIIESNEAANKFPQLSLFMGKPKVGKSRIMAKLPKALIISVEPTGYDEIKVDNIVKKNISLPTIMATIEFFFSKENTKFDKLVIDELRSLTQLFDTATKNRERVKYTADIPFGRGAMYLKDDIYRFVSWLKEQLVKNPDKYVFLVAHADDKNAEIRLDVNGKNESMILGMVDLVGYLTPAGDEDGNVIVNFKAKLGVEFGSRNKSIGNYNGILDWDKLFKLAVTGKVEKSD